MSNKVNDFNYVAQISDNFFFDCQKKSLFSQTGQIPLNRAEKEVLFILISRSPNMVSKRDLLSAGWAREGVSETSLFQTIRSLRIKLQEEEVGQYIQLVPRLGYQISIRNTLTLDDYNTRVAPAKRAMMSRIKPRLIMLLTLLAVAISSFLYNSLQTNYKYKLINDDKNNTIVFLSMFQDDFDYLLQANDIFITPGNLNNMLMFIYKQDDEFSIALCNKTPNGCDINTAHAINFNHSELGTIWDLLGNYLPNVPPLASINVLKDNTSTQSGVKSYNIFIENGDFTASLSHHFVNLIGESTWYFTTINYRPTADLKEFIAYSFRGGSSDMIDSSQMPFLVTIKNYPEYFYSVLSPEDKKQFGIKPLTQREIETNDFNIKVDEYTSYLLYRQPQLQLWLSEGYGFHWFIKEKSDDDVFNKLIEGTKCSALSITFDNPAACQ